MTYSRGGPPLWTLVRLHIPSYPLKRPKHTRVKLLGCVGDPAQCGTSDLLFLKITQSGEVQRDAADRRFMWVQCRQENKSACARRLDSPNFYRSSQEQINSGGRKKTLITRLHMNRKPADDSRCAPLPIRLCSAAFIIPRVQMRNPIRLKKWRISLNRGSGGKRCSSQADRCWPK